MKLRRKFSGKPGVVDFNAGNFTAVYLCFGVVLLIVSIPVYDGGYIESVVSRLYGYVFSFSEVFGDLVGGRESKVRGMLLLLYCFFSGVVSFFIFIWLIPVVHLRRLALERGAALDFFLNMLALLFFYLFVMLFLYVAHGVGIDGGMQGRYAEIIRPVVGSDMCFGLAVLLLVMALSYSFAVMLKSLFVKFL